MTREEYERAEASQAQMDRIVISTLVSNCVIGVAAIVALLCIVIASATK